MPAGWGEGLAAYAVCALPGKNRAGAARSGSMLPVDSKYHLFYDNDIDKLFGRK